MVRLVLLVLVLGWIECILIEPILNKNEILSKQYRFSTKKLYGVVKVAHFYNQILFKITKRKKTVDISRFGW